MPDFGPLVVSLLALNEAHGPGVLSVFLGHVARKGGLTGIDAAARSIVENILNGKQLVSVELKDPTLLLAGDPAAVNHDGLLIGRWVRGPATQRLDGLVPGGQLTLDTPTHGRVVVAWTNIVGYERLGN